MVSEIEKLNYINLFSWERVNSSGQDAKTEQLESITRDLLERNVKKDIY